MKKKLWRSHKISRREFISKAGQAGLLITFPSLLAKGMGNSFSQNTKHKIALFSKHLHWLDYNGMAETAAEIGFAGVDLTVRPKGHVLPEKVEEDLPIAAEACQKAGIEITMMSTVIADVSDSTTEKILKSASQLGIKFYRMAWYKYDKDISINKNHDNFKAKMKELAAMNQQYGIKGAYQNHAGTSLGSPVWDIGMILRDIDSEWLGCQYDIRHATVEGANSWPLGLQFVAPYINTIDIKDFQWVQIGGKWNLQNVPLGEGMVDFKLFFQLLHQSGIEVPYSIHLEYDLGGANKGARELTIPAQKVIAAMKKDLSILKNYLES
jgi:sugar phosphate isomerase/epimerase